MRRVLTVLALCLAPLAAAAGPWTLSPADSTLAFGSVKKGKVGETHHFTRLSGGVSAAGAVAVEIDLSSVETWIDVRNERMAKFVFKGMGPARLTANVDMAALEALKPGEGVAMDVDGVLTLGPASVAIAAPVYAMRATEGRAIVTTAEMIWVGAEELGIEAGVAKLQEVAKLPSIARAIPVTFRFVFDAGGVDAPTPAPTPVAAAAPGGDPKRGAKIFKKCRACHDAVREKNKVGPHLVGVIGRHAGAVEGYRYSKGMKAMDIVWTAENLHAFLAAPKDYVKGTKMSFRGLKKDADIADVIAYLASAK